MQVIPPLTITDAIFTSSTCAEPSTGETAWSSGSTYAEDDVVIVASSHRTYQSLQGGNTNHAPPVPPDTSNDWWIDIGPTNKWAMVDLLRNTATSNASPLTVVLTPGVRTNSIALIGMSADQVEITVTSSGDTVYTKTVDLVTLSRPCSNWYDYFLTPFGRTSAILINDLPPYVNAIITVSLTADSGDVSCASLVIGNFVDLGKTQYDAVSDALNFSTIDRDTFGNSVLIQRRSVPTTQQTTWADAGQVDNIRAARTLLNAQPAVWSGLDDADQPYFEALLILGIYKTFTINLTYMEIAVVTLELEEV